MINYAGATPLITIQRDADGIVALADKTTADLIAWGKAAIEQAGSFEQVREIAARADALKAYQRSIGCARDAVDAAVEIRLRAERRMGGELAGLDKSKGGRPSTENPPTSAGGFDKPTLKELGVSSQQSSKYQNLASIPEPVFDETVEVLKETGDLSAASIKQVVESVGDVSNKSPEDQREAVRETTLVNRTSFTGNNEWFTPDATLAAARAVLGAFDLDPASHPVAQERVQAERFFTAEDDGLAQEWHGRVWLNPPYAQPAIENFVDKMVSEVASRRVTAAIMLTHNYTDTAWFQKAAVAAQAICFTRGRVRFVSPTGELAAPTQGQAFFFYGHDVAVFREGFRNIGLVVEVMP